MRRCFQCGGKHYAKGMCQNHYQQEHRALLEEVAGPCSTEGCERPAIQVGMCSSCYAKDWRARQKDRTPRRLCSERGCDRVHHAKGLCVNHYQRSIRPQDQSLDPAYFAEEVAFFREFGWSDERIATKLGMTLEAMQKRLYRGAA